MYLLFKSVNDQQLGIVQRVGTYMYFTIGYIPDTHVDIVDYRNLNAVILPDDVAKAWIFIGCYKGTINVRQDTPQNDILQIISSEEELGTKSVYTLTDSDKANAVLIQKEILNLILNEVYDKRMKNLNLVTSDLEMSTWEQQKTEALAYPEIAPILLQNLADTRGITLEEMVNKVLTAVSNYNSQVNDLFVKKQAIKTEISNCNSIAEINKLAHLKFEIEMPFYQKENEGITDSATFNI